MVGRINKPKRVIAIAASAGGINALMQVVSRLPHDLPAAVILIQHLKPDHKTQLHEYLARRSLLPVCLADNKLPLEAGVIYVSVPGLHLRLKGGYLFPVRSKPVNYVWPSADVLFASAAKEYGSKVIGVILTGTGCDGARGCQEIKEKGGMTIAQDEKTSFHFAMPQAAIKAGTVDYVLPLEKIPEKIVALTRRGVRSKKKKESRNRREQKRR